MQKSQSVEKGKMRKRILIVAAHPDDEILGCAGTVARLIKEGNEAFTLILGEGVTARDDVRDIEKRKQELSQLKGFALSANKLLGIKEIFMHNFPDNRFDTVPLIDIAQTIEKIKNEVRPDIVFTHYAKDLNKDHQIAYMAVLIATRPQPREITKELYSFEVLSSTEWNYPLLFSPDIFFDISETIDLKLKAIGCYKTELRKFPHPRSLKGVKLNAAFWGMRIGLRFAEAFQCVRKIK